MRKKTKSKRITKKMLMEFINKVADIKPSNIPGDSTNCYYSKIDGSYFTIVGMDGLFKMLLRRGITEQLQASSKCGRVVSIGYNPKQKKWYGWSHRALYGFGIGSTCRKGDCHYNAANKKDFLEDMIRFWKDKGHEKTTGVKVGGDKPGVMISWLYNNTVNNKSLHGQIGGIFVPYPKKFGRGEWVAKTMKDAKQMAIDFARGVA